VKTKQEPKGQTQAFYLIRPQARARLARKLTKPMGLKIQLFRKGPENFLVVLSKNFINFTKFSGRHKGSIFKSLKTNFIISKA
jgi:hypothetical protein